MREASDDVPSGSKRKILFIALVLIVGAIATLIFLRLGSGGMGQATARSSPLVSTEHVPSADDSVIKALERWKARAFEFFLLLAFLIGGSAFLLLELGIVRKVWGMEFGHRQKRSPRSTSRPSIKPGDHPNGGILTTEDAEGTARTRVFRPRGSGPRRAAWKPSRR